MILNQILKNKKWYGINTLGIGLAFAVALIIFTHVKKELSYDNFHSKADDIYRITTEDQQLEGQPPTSGIDGKLILPLYTNFPDIKEVVRLIHPDNTVITADKNNFSSNQLFFTNSQFFKVFDYKLLRGNRTSLFNQPNQVVISKKTALAYFGTEEAIGKEISIQVQYLYSKSGNYTVAGVMDDFPENSHFKADLLFSINNNEDINQFHTYTYLLLQKERNLNSLKSLINAYWKKNTKDGEPDPISQLMPLRDIHLYSHNADEMSTNGSMTSLIILIAGALIVFLIAFINYTNLNYVQFITDLKDFKVRMINGASLVDLGQIIFIRSLIPISFAILFGGLLAYNFDTISASSFNLDISAFDLLWISLIFYLIFALASLLPLATTKVSKDLARSPYQGSKKFVASLLFQFMLSIAAIITTIVLHKQINLVNNLHPGDEKSAIVVMTDVPYHMIAKFEVLKESFLKHSEIRNVSAAFYKPGLNIPFSYPFEMEGADKTVEKKLNMFSIEEDFFKLFNIKPLAGSLDMGITSSIPWENIALRIHDQNPNKDEFIKNLNNYTKEHGGFQEKYILNQSALKVLGIQNPEDAIGKSFQFNFMAPELFQKGKVIAVIGDLHYGDMFSKEEPMVLASKNLFNSTFIAKIDPRRKAEALQSLKTEWETLSPDHPFRYEFVDDLYEQIYFNQYKEMKALTLFSILSIVLSVLGMFALSSFSIQHKTKEIGIRKANGSTSLEILTLLIREYTQWVVVAFLIACPIAYYIARDWLSNFAYHIELSWWIFVVSGVMALIIAILTVSWQTWKAATQNPVEALKYE
ncbi:putative ABC transport system permease protein [Ancylomarina subtilis]|uniref:Putative ABC transport system permease protein n=1 Tax=Ancylomarina subtilis TaxID=1639035 RepID=A0A4Q7VJH2_9BACT|nr:ABC transporter permease [Ancylomarina subtilis]RZT96244.1 putative ABC transport system permease protein [Ancylomarina subtilis]